jgi:signal transduction histidine kinase
MTSGTSAHGEGLSRLWADAGRIRAFGAWRRVTAGADWRIDWARVAEGPAPLQLLALSAIGGLLLGLSINAGWPAGADGGAGGTALLHLAVLIAPCVAAAAIALRPGAPVATPVPRQERQDHPAAEEQSRLLAQMHHELRTPLNAMIGFSEAMLRELHGPLGNARYQEYVAHISESGGRLLKASEDALAVAATMSALMADRPAQRRARLTAGLLLRDTWVALGAASEARDRDIRLSMDDGAAAEIECDRQATSEALQHLLGEAVARRPPGGAVAVRGGRRLIEIAVEPVAPGRVGSSPDSLNRPTEGPAAGDGLRLILARSLIEMQGATLCLSAGPRAGEWRARIAFPAAADGQRRQPCSTGSETRRRVSLRRGRFAAGAALHASAGSRAAPPA